MKTTIVETGYSYEYDILKLTIEEENPNTPVISNEFKDFEVELNGEAVMYYAYSDADSDTMVLTVN